MPSSAQQHCLCFLGARVGLFRMGCLVQLQQSLRSLVLLLRMGRLRPQRLQCSVLQPARGNAGKIVPSSAQRHCLCFQGAREALFRIGWLVQLQLQSLRTLVVFCVCYIRFPRPLKTLNLYIASAIPIKLVTRSLLGFLGSLASQYIGHWS